MTHVQLNYNGALPGADAMQQFLVDDDNDDNGDDDNDDDDDDDVDKDFNFSIVPSLNVTRLQPKYESPLPGAGGIRAWSF